MGVTIPRQVLSNFIRKIAEDKLSRKPANKQDFSMAPLALTSLSDTLSPVSSKESLPLLRCFWSEHVITVTEKTLGLRSS